MFLTLYYLQSHFHLKDKVKSDVFDHIIACEIKNEKDYTTLIFYTLDCQYQVMDPYCTFKERSKGEGAQSQFSKPIHVFDLNFLHAYDQNYNLSEYECNIPISSCIPKCVQILCLIWLQTALRCNLIDNRVQYDILIEYPR